MKTAAEVRSANLAKAGISTSGPNSKTRTGPRAAKGRSKPPHSQVKDVYTGLIKDLSSVLKFKRRDNYGMWEGAAHFPTMVAMYKTVAQCAEIILKNKAYSENHEVSDRWPDSDGNLIAFSAMDHTVTISVQGRTCFVSIFDEQQYWG